MRYVVFLFFSFEGRIGRLEYFVGSIVMLIGILLWYLAVSFFESVLTFNELLLAGTMLLVLMTWGHAALNIKRFCDFGARRLWWLCFVPYLNIAIFLFMSVIKSRGRLNLLVPLE